MRKKFRDKTFAVWRNLKKTWTFLDRQVALFIYYTPKTGSVLHRHLIAPLSGALAQPRNQDSPCPLWCTPYGRVSWQEWTVWCGLHDMQNSIDTNVKTPFMWIPWGWIQKTIIWNTHSKLWLDLGKPSQFAQELKSILLLIMIATLKDYPDTVTPLL